MSLALSAIQAAPTCSDDELVAAVRDGSDRAFEQLYSRYRGRITSYVFRMVGDHARAEDIVQEVFISALRRLRQTGRPVAFKPWLYEIAKNACIDEFRRTRRAREVPLEHDDESEQNQRWLASGQSPDVAIESKQSLENLRGAFHGLSESHHRLIVMREFEGLSYNQIGESLGMTRPVVESTLFRARRRLSAEYNELVTGRRCEHVQSLIETTEPKTLLKLGVRERRQLARHLAHCQPCRRHARLAGVDESLFHAPGVGAKIAALLPFPWLRLRRGGAQREAASGASSQSFALLQPLQNVVRYVDAVAPASGLGRTAAAVAALAVAGLGGEAVTAVASHPHRVAVIRSAHPNGSPGVRSPRSRSSSQTAATSRRAPNGSAWVRIGKAATVTAASASAPAAGTSAVGAHSNGSGTPSTRHDGVSSPAGSVAGGSAPKQASVGGVRIPGVSSSGSVPKLSAPSVPKLSAPSVPKLSKPTVPSVPTGSGSNGTGIQAPQLPKVSVPGGGSLPQTPSVPNPTHILNG